MTTLAQLRLALATAKGALRDAEADHKTVRAVHEQMAINSGALDGCTNDKQRERTLLIALNSDKHYTTFIERLRGAEYEVDRIQAEIDIEKDARTARELSIREEANRVLDRLAAAYEELARVNPVQAAKATTVQQMIEDWPLPI